MIRIKEPLFSGKWFSTTGPDQDVIISSRVRISRNVESYNFPAKMSAEEYAALRRDVEDIFDGYKNGDSFRRLCFSELSPLQRRLLLERNLVSEEFCLRDGACMFLREDGLLTASLNEIDHLRITSIQGGSRLPAAFGEVDNLDSLLDESLEYAVSLQLGYLTSEISNVGTGLRASVMLHLPGLVACSCLDNVLKTVYGSDFTIKGFFSEQEGSLGSIYQISNQKTLGYSEKEILEKLEDVAQQLVNYERKAREELFEAKRMEILDGIFRAYGILKYARRITYQEAINLLSSLRMGCALGIIKEVPLETITSLFFLSLKSHVLYMTGGERDETDAESIAYRRAELIRYVLDSQKPAVEE